MEQLLESGPSTCLLCLKPPYVGYEEIAHPDALAPDTLPLGALLVVELVDDSQWPAVAAQVPRLRSRFPAAPVVLRVRRDSMTEPGELARRAAELHVKALLYDDEPPRETLQPILTDPATVPDTVADWLAVRGIASPPALAGLIVEIFRQAPAHPRLRSLLRALGRPERTVRSWFQRAGLPGPGAWLASAHAIYAALRLQRERQTSLLTIAVECGYSDHSSLSRQAVRLFGARPGEIRQTLGWEGLLDRWLGRAGIGTG